MGCFCWSSCPSCTEYGAQSPSRLPCSWSWQSASRALPSEFTTCPTSSAVSSWVRRGSRPWRLPSTRCASIVDAARRPRGRDSNQICASWQGSLVTAVEPRRLVKQAARGKGGTDQSVDGADHDVTEMVHAAVETRIRHQYRDDRTHANHGAAQPGRLDARGHGGEAGVEHVAGAEIATWIARRRWRGVQMWNVRVRATGHGRRRDQTARAAGGLRW